MKILAAFCMVGTFQGASGYLVLVTSGEASAGEETNGSVSALSVKLCFCAVFAVPGSM